MNATFCQQDQVQYVLKEIVQRDRNRLCNSKFQLLQKHSRVEDRDLKLNIREAQLKIQEDALCRKEKELISKEEGIKEIEHNISIEFLRRENEFLEKDNKIREKNLELEKGEALLKYLKTKVDEGERVMNDRKEELRECKETFRRVIEECGILEDFERNLKNKEKMISNNIIKKSFS